MRLKSLEVRNYKTILDTAKVEIDPNVTCLLGKNEAGKSSVLQALWKFNNVSGANYDRLPDLPAELYTRLRKSDPEVAVLEFLLEEQDSQELLTAFPSLKAAPPSVVVRSTYDRQRTVQVELDHAPKLYGSIRAAITGTIETLNPSGGAEGTPQGVAAIKALQALDKVGQPDTPARSIPAATLQAALTALKAVPTEGLSEIGASTINELEKFAMHANVDIRKDVETWLLERLPIFIYFEDYGRLKTRIHLPDFVAKQSTAPKSTEEQMLHRTQVALFEWANLDAQELRTLGLPKKDNEALEAVERRKAERARILESASYHLSGDWIEWWDQRTHKLKITADGDELELRVSDDVNPWEIDFGERSRGFQWFFSFYLTFLVESSKSHRGAIILLDEPGLHLHPTAQEKLLAFFQKIAGKNQILYSSHSMFMVDPNHVENIRTVYLKPKDADDPKSRAYTSVSSGTEPEGDRDTLLPMQAAGAYRLAQTVFLGKRTLIVEGISDYWLLRTLSTQLNEKGGGGLHSDTLVLWAGGTSHILPLATIMASREQIGPNRMAVLLDSDRAGLEKAKKLVETMAHGRDSVIMLGDAINIPKAQAEDIAEMSELLAGLHSLGRVPSSPPAIHPGETNVDTLKRIFAENGWGDLDHDTKARTILRLTDSWWKGGAPEAPTLARARLLFSVINQRFEKLLANVASPAQAGV